MEPYASVGEPCLALFVILLSFFFFFTSVTYDVTFSPVERLLFFCGQYITTAWWWWWWVAAVAVEQQLPVDIDLWRDPVWWW